MPRIAVLALLLTASVVLSTAVLGVTVAATGGGAADAATVDTLTDDTASAATTDAATVGTATDSDGDGLTDAAEVHGWGTDPNDADTDGDGTDDGAETVEGTPRTGLRTLRVTKAGAEDGRAEYSLSTSGQLSGLTDFEDTLDGTTASGRVGPAAGNDTVAFAGDVESFSLDGPAVVYLDGEVVDPSDVATETHRLTIVKAGTADGVARYRFTVDGTLTPSSDFEDSIDGNTASGRIGPTSGTDSVTFTGDIESFSLEGPAVVILDGEAVDPTTLGTGGAPDSDDDDLTDPKESEYGTDPTDVDTDDDGLSDGREVRRGLDPTDSDTDGDGLSDGEEVTVHESDPKNTDTDRDGLSDGEEVNKYGTDPADWDTDADDLFDGDEIRYGTDPLDPDTDDDGVLDADDVPSHTLVVTKEGTEDGVATYEFSVSGEISPNDDFEDSTDGNAASGRVGPASGTDSVNFTGSLTSFSLDGPANVYLDGREVDPATLNATRIEFDRRYEGNVSDDEPDVYTFTAEKGEYVRIPLYSGVPGIARGTVYAPSGAKLDSLPSDPDTVPLGVRAPEDGTYRLVVEERGNYTRGNEGIFRFRAEKASPDEFEPNDDRANATRLKSGAPVEAVLGQNESDWYAVDAREGQALTATLTRDDFFWESDVSMTVVGPDGSELASDATDCGWRCDLHDLTVTAPSDGTYYVRVDGDEAKGFIAYTLNVGAGSAEPETHTLSISKAGAEDGVATYRFSVDGEISPNDDFEDSIDGNTASGRVGPASGTDSVTFTGNLTSFSLDGPATVFLDGEERDAATPNATDG